VEPLKKEGDEKEEGHAQTEEVASEVQVPELEPDPLQRRRPSEAAAA
jgi:hypothetical protein